LILLGVLPLGGYNQNTVGKMAIFNYYMRKYLAKINNMATVLTINRKSYIVDLL